MSEPSDAFQESVAWVEDTGLFIVRSSNREEDLLSARIFVAEYVHRGISCR